MAKEISLAHTATAETLYAILRDTVGRVCTVSTGAFAAYATASLANYKITMTEQGTASRYYSGDMPASVAAGLYYATVYKQAGGSPAEGDAVKGSGDIEWNGTTAIPLSFLPVDVVKWLGTAASTPTVAGVPNVNTKTINDVATTAITTIKAVQGLAVDGVITTLTNLPAITANWLTAAGLAEDASTEIATEILDQAAGVETGLTVRQALRLIAAATAAKLSGADTTTIVIRNAVADNKNRITATVDAYGNRSAITLDLT